MDFEAVLVTGVTAVYFAIAVGAVRAGGRRANLQWRRGPLRR